MAGFWAGFVSDYLLELGKDCSNSCPDSSISEAWDTVVGPVVDTTLNSTVERCELNPEKEVTESSVIPFPDGTTDLGDVRLAS